MLMEPGAIVMTGMFLALLDPWAGLYHGGPFLLF